MMTLKDLHRRLRKTGLLLRQGAGLGLWAMGAALLAAACVGEANPPAAGIGSLVVAGLSRDTVCKATIDTRAVDEGLAVEVLEADGTLHEGMAYDAGTQLPARLTLPVGDYKLHAFSENQTSWRNDNGGLGSPVYDLTEPFAIEADWITYLDVQVPMRNYGVTHSVPDHFDSWFPTAEFTVEAAGRMLQPSTQEVAYFDPDDGACTFWLHLVNTDGEEYTTERHEMDAPQAGHLYEIHYTFVSEDDPTHLRITISYEDGFTEVIDTQISLE